MYQDTSKFNKILIASAASFLISGCGGDGSSSGSGTANMPTEQTPTNTPTNTSTNQTTDTTTTPS